MKKIIAFILLTLVTTFGCFAAAKGGFTTADAGIVTPDVATGMTWFEIYGNDVEGNLIVCIEKQLGGSCKTWVPLISRVPKGKTYVGFRVVSGGYGYRQLELYWK